MSKSFYTPHDFDAINVLTQKHTVSVLGTAVTVGNLQSGDVCMLTATAGSVVTLPSPVAGATFNFIVANSTSNQINTPTATLFGGVGRSVYSTAGNLNASANARITTTSGSAIGDTYNIVSDGTRYYLSGMVANYNACLFS